MLLATYKDLRDLREHRGHKVFRERKVFLFKAHKALRVGVSKVLLAMFKDLKALRAFKEHRVPKD